MRTEVEETNCLCRCKFSQNIEMVVTVIDSKRFYHFSVFLCWWRAFCSYAVLRTILLRCPDGQWGRRFRACTAFTVVNKRLLHLAYSETTDTNRSPSAWIADICSLDHLHCVHVVWRANICGHVHRRVHVCF
jgi:hypothetical protein